MSVEQDEITVFISYSHDSEEHRETVLQLSERLRQDGFKTFLDQYVDGSPPRGWPSWMLDQLDAANFVLVVCTETYYRRFRGHEVPGKGKGVDWEGALITQEMYNNRSQELKFIPVFLSPINKAWIPEPLRAATHYTLNSAADYQSLLAFLSGKAGVEPRPVGERKKITRRQGEVLTFEQPTAPNRQVAPISPAEFSRREDEKEALTLSSMIPFDWVTIPAGYFLMGSDKEQHRLYLPEYRIARVPVTVAQFGHFVAATHHETTAEKQGWAADWTGTNWQPLKDAYWEHPHGPNSDVQEDHPVTCISWDDAVEFCKWAGVRLPSEAEWEKAAAWDPGAQVKHVYPWGDELPDKSRCNFGMLVGDTTSVGRYPQGVNGLYDMAGNVWEWTSSLYKKYPYEADDRENAQATGERVVRGGSFFQPAKYVRCVHRHWHKPDATVSDFGFRVCGAERGGMIVIKRQHQR